MLAKVRTCAVVGLDGYIVEVEVGCGGPHPLDRGGAGLRECPAGSS